MHKLLLGLFLLLLSDRAFSAVPKVLRACGDSDEWPPFTYYERNAGKKTKTVIGYNSDLLKALLDLTQRRVEITLLPWKRCLERASRGDFEIVLDGARTPVREKDFLFPRPHYHLTPIVLFRRDWSKPDLARPEVWTGINVCGQLGYAYDFKDTPFEKIKMQMPARSFKSVVMMLKSGRCDLVLHDLEILAGYARIGDVDILSDKTLDYAHLAIPTIKTQLYLLVSRSSPFREELVDLLSQGIQTLEKTGVTKKIYERYVPPHQL